MGDAETSTCLYARCIILHYYSFHYEKCISFCDSQQGRPCVGYLLHRVRARRDHSSGFDAFVINAGEMISIGLVEQDNHATHNLHVSIWCHWVTKTYGREPIKLFRRKNTGGCQRLRSPRGAIYNPRGSSRGARIIRAYESCDIL